MNIRKNYKNSNIILIIILLLIAHSNKAFYNFYVTAKTPLKERLIRTYGYCDNESYGFISKIFEDYSIKDNIQIINDNPNFTFNNSNWFKYIINEKYNKNKLIIINNKNVINFENNDYVSVVFENTYYGKYKIIEKFENCYFLDKND